MRLLIVEDDMNLQEQLKKLLKAIDDLPDNYMII